MASYRSLSALMDAVNKKVAQVIQQATDQTVKDAISNLQTAYGGGAPRFYKRTGTLAASPLGWVEGSGGETVGVVEYRDEYSYLAGQGVSTPVIFDMAENGVLAMSGGWYVKTKNDARRNLMDAAKTYFG